MQLENYYDTLWELFDAVEEFYDVKIPTIYGGVGYEETLQVHIAPETGRKYLHVSIYRTPAGRYELTSYKL